MDDHGTTQGAHSQQWTYQIPKVADAFKRGSTVSLTTWGGRELSGTVCDHEQTGLLLDVRGTEHVADGYVFLPWSSIEQVAIREVLQRRVKSLPS